VGKNKDLVRDCRNCAGTEWVCENHPDLPWGGRISQETACECGAGMPCGACNLEMASLGFVYRREKAIVTWLLELEPSYSGWNDHDEHFDTGWNAAIMWVADQIGRGKHWAAASAIETGSDATGTGAAEGESAIGCAETPGGIIHE